MRLLAVPAGLMQPWHLRPVDQITKDPQPKRARVWVRFGGTPLLVDATVTSWTSAAAAVAFVVAETEYKAWVWASAVREFPGLASSS